MQRNVLLDLDGTLLDSQLGITRCVNHALEQLGVAPRDARELRCMIGPPLAAGFPPLLGSDEPALLARAIELYRERYDRVGIFESELFDGVEQLLADLETRGHSLFLVTAKPEPYARRLLDHFSISPFFAGIYAPTFSDYRDGKSHLVRDLLRTEGLAPSDSVMVGDRDRDILAGLENRIASIGVLWGYGTQEELSNSRATAVVETTAELFQLISGSDEDRGSPT